MKMQARPAVPRLRPNAVAVLSAEQSSCFLATRDDLRAVGGDRRVTGNAIGRLLSAFSRATPSDWRIAVCAIDRLIATAPASAEPFALRRLAQFVLENGDLLAA
jgi:hypothetical protein